MKKDTKKLTKIFKALADENRLKILLCIYKQECQCSNHKSCNGGCACIKDLSKPLKITVPTVSHHIKVLVNAGLVTTKKEGRWVYCYVNKKVIDDIYRFLDSFCNNKGRSCKK